MARQRMLRRHKTGLTCWASEIMSCRCLRRNWLAPAPEDSPRILWQRESCDTNATGCQLNDVH